MRCRACMDSSGPWCLCALCEQCISLGVDHHPRCPDVCHVWTLHDVECIGCRECDDITCQRCGRCQDCAPRKCAGMWTATWA